MENIKKYVVDFIEGKINPKDFISECERNSQIFEWINSVVPVGKTCYKITITKDDRGVPRATQEVVPYDIRIVWETNTFSAYGNLGIQLNVHSTISKLITEVFPEDNINIDNSIEKKHSLLLNVCPDYICGKQAEKLVEQILDENPKATKKLIKEIIKETFHLEKGKYPRWAQDSEWPFSETGKPMKYISQKNKNSEVIELVFEDVDTGKKVTIEDIF